MNRFSIAFGFVIGLISWLVASTIEVIRRANAQSYNEMCERIITINYANFVQALDLMDLEFGRLEIATNAITGEEYIEQYDLPLDQIKEDLDDLRIQVEKRYHESLVNIIFDQLYQDPENIFIDLSEQRTGINDRMNKHQALLDRKPGDRSGIKTVS